MKQQDLLGGYEEDLYEVIEAREHKFGNAYWPIYVHTRPKNWVGPELSDELPWEGTWAMRTDGQK